jgi:GNAT superfamily N-acetyltransferase
LTQRYNLYELDDSLERIDFERVHGWLTKTYWSPGISRETVERGALHSSLVVGAYHEETQVGYLRVVSDTTRFAWICDVYVGEAHRGKGLAKAMVQYALEHPDHREVRRWLLATADAHAIYQAVGFNPLPSPERWMIYSSVQDPLAAKSSNATEDPGADQPN